VQHDQEREEKKGGRKGKKESSTTGGEQSDGDERNGLLGALLLCCLSLCVLECWLCRVERVGMRALSVTRDARRKEAKQREKQRAFANEEFA
jgi:hypothetical protein